MYDCTSKSVQPCSAFLVRQTGIQRWWSCSDLIPASYLTLAALCPNLEELSLELCGQLDTDTVIKWGQVFPQLRKVELWGPFNVRKEGWIRFFKDRGETLEGLLITSVGEVYPEQPDVSTESAFAASQAIAEVR